MVASLVVAGVLMLGMLAASGWGAINLAVDARIPVHCGSVEHCFLVSKRVGLVIWPAVGAVCYGVLSGIAGRSSMASNWVPGVRDVLTPAVLCVVLGFQAGALVIASRGAGRVEGRLMVVRPGPGTRTILHGPPAGGRYRHRWPRKVS